MPAKKKPAKKPTKKQGPKNLTDPNLLARDVMEVFLGEPLIPVNHKTEKAPSPRKPAKKK